ILEALVPHQPRLLVQTRGPLVVRDLDVLMKFAAVRVNVSIPTDSEAVRLAFQPKAPALERRWGAAAAVGAAGPPGGICLTRVLPLEDPDRFVQRLVAFRPDVLVVQDFHDSGGAFGADTGLAARRLLAKYPWTLKSYRQWLHQLREQSVVYEGEAGFFP